jgi:hypothetical protein
MVSQEFVKRLLNKKIHIDYIDENSEYSNLVWVEGTFIELASEEDKDGEVTAEFVEVETETDLDRIPISSIRKIYLKE